ncbi:MAG: NUDIX domain-containing protein [Planctomycetes bacterium]|nr:NUDIX domain-containing protein [Planctomycetota bacterium]
MRSATSCGVVLLRERPVRSVLVLRLYRNHDLPKGHLEAGEDERGCALRELVEETAIPADAVRLDPTFRATTRYHARVPGGMVDKTLVVFLGWIERDVPIRLTEHHGFAWIPWANREIVDSRIIRPLFAAVEQRLSEAST